jgi:anaerobic selenocysteine-containing dehydrogenase
MTSRRSFLKTTAAIGTGLLMAPNYLPAIKKDIRRTAIYRARRYGERPGCYP